MRVLLTLLSVAVATACSAERGARPEFRIVMAGDTAPAYGALSLVGDSIDFAELRGRALLVNVWATWCGPCRAEMPELQELHEQYGDDLSVIGVSIDQAGDQDLIEGFLEDVGIDFTILLDPEGRVTRRFTTIGVPETFLIDAEGIVRKRWVGRFMPHAPANLSVIEGALQSDS